MESYARAYSGSTPRKSGRSRLACKTDEIEYPCWVGFPRRTYAVRTMSNDHRMIVRVPRELIAVLREVAAQQDRTMSNVVRRACVEYVARERPESASKP